MEKQISELDENARRKFEQLNNFEQDDITFVTIIIKGYKLNGIENDWNFIQIDIENEMVNFKNTWSTFIKTYEPGLVFRGRFELDIVKFEVLPDKSHKKMLFEDMGIEWAEGDQILNLHVHMIAAKDGLDRKSLLDHAKEDGHTAMALTYLRCIRTNQRKKISAISQIIVSKRKPDTFNQVE